MSHVGGMCGALQTRGIPYQWFLGVINVARIDVASQKLLLASPRGFCGVLQTLCVSHTEGWVGHYKGRVSVISGMGGALQTGCTSRHTDPIGLWTLHQ